MTYGLEGREMEPGFVDCCNFPRVPWALPHCPLVLYLSVSGGAWVGAPPCIHRFALRLYSMTMLGRVRHRTVLRIGIALLTVPAFGAARHFVVPGAKGDP